MQNAHIENSNEIKASYEWKNNSVAFQLTFDYLFASGQIKIAMFVICVNIIL